MNGQDSLPASLLRQWAYCPRIPFFREVLGLFPTTPKWVAQGVDYDSVQFLLSRDRRFRNLGIEGFRVLRRVSLSDRTRQIHGIADLILLGRDSLYVCEFKLRAVRFERGMRLQLGAYALMAEQRYGVGCVKLLIITGKPMRILAEAWDDKVRQEIERAVRQVHESFAAGLLPRSDAGPAKCGICEYINYCNDRE